MGDVSIHASAWEATPQPPSELLAEPVSIHASAWEATPNMAMLTLNWPGFNPRLRVGGDQTQKAQEGLNNVSIHASAWEATSLLP